MGSDSCRFWEKVKKLANTQQVPIVGEYFLVFYISMMKNCKHGNSIWLLVLRLGFGAFLLMGGIMKIMHPEMADMIWWAAHALGLTFLSTTVWFWLAAIGETLAGFLFVIGACLPIASLLTIIIMIVAFFGALHGDMQQGMSAITFFIAALGLAFTGPGAWSIKALCTKCKDGNCDTKKEVVEA